MTSFVFPPLPLCPDSSPHSALSPPVSWCNTHPEFFAISSSSPATGAILHVHNLGYLSQQPTQLAIAAKPHYVRDFDFLATRGVPRIAAAVGRSLVVMPIGSAEK